VHSALNKFAFVEVFKPRVVLFIGVAVRKFVSRVCSAVRTQTLRTKAKEANFLASSVNSPAELAASKR